MINETNRYLCAPLGHSWPGLHWWLSLTASDQGAWVAGLGAFAAAAVAAVISVAQFRRDTARERRIASAIAPALIGDLNLALESVKIIEQRAFKLTQARIAHHEEIEAVLRSTSRLKLVAFERFNDQLPLLGQRAAPAAIECYATIIRSVTFVEAELGRDLATSELLLLLPVLAERSTHLAALIQTAASALKELIPASSESEPARPRRPHGIAKG